MARLNSVRFLGDVHGKIEQYLHRVSPVKCSVQLGDMGFKPELNYLRTVDWLDSANHKILAGNHDDYQQTSDGLFVNQTPHFLGDFGVWTCDFFCDIFFVRGGRSIDASRRVEGVDWFRQEELNYSQGLSVIELYKEVKPEFVISHECPEEVVFLLEESRVMKAKRRGKKVFGGPKTWNGLPILPSSTARLLQCIFEIHQPKVWLFGHHQSFNLVHNGTRFICLNELEYVDINEKLEII